jgi:predicted transcriptional regulator
MPKTKSKTTPWSDIRDKRIAPADEPRLAKIREQMEAELALAALRKRRKASQAEIAKKLAVSQSNVSQFERGGDPKISTVADYVGALGGKLELVAVFDDERVTF